MCVTWGVGWRRWQRKERINSVLHSKSELEYESLSELWTGSSEFKMAARITIVILLFSVISAALVVIRRFVVTV